MLYMFCTMPSAWGGWGWGGGGRGVISYIWHNTDVRSEWPPFSTKSIWMIRFFWIPVWKAPLFWHPGICTVLLVFNELTAIFVWLPAIIWYMIGPLFSTKSIRMTRFFWIPVWKAPIFWHPGICTYFSLGDFSRLLVLLVFNELTAIFV